MTAEEARKLTEESLTAGYIVTGYLAYIHEIIKIMAARSERTVNHRFTGIGLLYPTAEQKKTIYKKLEAEGYEITHHPNPDPSDPRSAGWTSIKW